jgi:REP element-mobilizing transposase RayT
MMRGINHQNIFEEPEDYYQFINTLDRLRVLYDDLGLPCGTSFTLYGYCLMANHFHLLICEREETIGNVVKRIASSYVYYYNHKYLRDGHLFKERFKSEPVRSSSARLLPTGRKNDISYFTTLLRYIHQNPVKAGIVKEVKDYEYSSWGEYTGQVETAFQICDTQTVLKRIPFDNLNEWVNEPLPSDACYLDGDEEQAFNRYSDEEAWKVIKELTGASNASEFQKLDRGRQREALRELRDLGASVRQLQRLTGLGRGLIQRI